MVCFDLIYTYNPPLLVGILCSLKDQVVPVFPFSLTERVGVDEDKGSVSLGFSFIQGGMS